MNVYAKRLSPFFIIFQEICFSKQVIKVRHMIKVRHFTNKCLSAARTKDVLLWIVCQIVTIPYFILIAFCLALLSRRCRLGMNNTSLKFQIEPGLFEWGAWFRPKLPSWMAPSELAAMGYPVSANYRPVCHEVSCSETLEEYYHRSFHTVSKILDRHPESRQGTAELNIFVFL